MKGEACKGRCCYLNHVAHAEGYCCKHEIKRGRFSLPGYLARAIRRKSKALGMPLSDYLRLTLETFGETCEAEPRECQADRIEVDLPLYLLTWIEASGGSDYVARRLAAALGHEPKDCEGC